MKEETGDAEVAVVVRGLTKAYGGKAVVDDVSFTVHKGEFFGLLGPNGAGKTTTLEMIEGLRRPDGGSVSLLGLSPWPRNTSLLTRIGVQLQSSAFFERLTAREQLTTFGALYGADTDRTEELLALVGLTEQAETREDKLSGGQRQRLSIACALVHDPEILFLDEPTASLDPQARRNLWDVLRGIREQGKTIVYTTHYIEEAERLCDRIAILDGGGVIAMDTPTELISGLGRPTSMELPTSVIGPDDVRRLPGVEEVTEEDGRVSFRAADPGSLMQALTEKGIAGSLQIRAASLEDVFLELTGREYRS
ncbi:ABC transporter ATP-binding protein [Nocardiopsis listeri]|uniref:ABC transporter ATP-binding protein n=1 Tax=Nocardiopsis listeri TaxID=53440 RepID=UPI000835AC26|nr:ABC transporter ATP-binding protein [Nocardiopsis listeri]